MKKNTNSRPKGKNFKNPGKRFPRTSQNKSGFKGKRDRPDKRPISSKPLRNNRNVERSWQKK